MAYTALERSDNARVRKFAPCANLTNLKEAIVSKKENITNSERTGKKDNVSDPVFRSNRQRESTRSPFADWSERRDTAPGAFMRSGAQVFLKTNIRAHAAIFFLSLMRSFTFKQTPLPRRERSALSILLWYFDSSVWYDN